VNALMSSARTGTGRDDWQTPPAVLELVRQVAPIALDPCSAPGNPVGAERWCCPPGDGLSISWGVDSGLVYVNPPYSQCRAWLAKCDSEATAGVEIVALVPARTDTRAWHESIWPAASAVCFWRGRLRFVGATASAPFPSAIVYYGSRAGLFRRVFCGVGHVVVL